MKKTLISILFILSTQAFANDSKYLIKEMESLRDSLKLEDPKREELTLRLADLYFDVSIQEGAREDGDLLKKSRMKALELYKHSLNGTDHLKPVTGESKVKIQFQIARLFSRLDEGKTAAPYYLDILNNKEAPKKMIEQSALALAEWYEEEANFPMSKKYYDQAISLCSNLETCNYSNYRLSWLYYKDTKLDQAISTMEKSLWLDADVIRENSLTDLLLFLSNKETDGMHEFEMIRKIASRAKRPELNRLLVEAFYVAGNRLAGSNLLAELNKEDSNLYYEVRLLEEFYGFRKWDKVAHYLSLIEKKQLSDIPQKKEEANEVLTILRRFIVQVDAEMQMIKDLNVFLKRSINVYLKFYPNDELRKKMQAGWLAAEDSPQIKIDKLQTWIKEDILHGVANDEIRKLRQTRLSIAQTLKKSDIVIEEAKALAIILKDSKEADEFLYVAAREEYAQKRYEQALPYFLTVVKNAKSSNDIGKWAILSQNLILDIYNNQKNYDGIISQISSWKEMIGSNPISDELKKETNSMEQILIQAQFEKAVAMKESRLAMESFTNFCLNDVYPDKSCLNAKVLSIKFKDQERLVLLLEKMKDEKSLLTEYELMGRFKEAARLQEKMELSSKAAMATFLKVAFLYELDQELIERDRILNLMVTSIKLNKSIPTEIEKAVYSALDDANLLSENALILPWSINLKLKLASKLEITNPSAVTKKILMSQKEASGPVWSKVVLSQLEEDYLKANKISFYGTQSKKLFKQRTNAIEKFVSLAKSRLDGADLEARVYILHMLKMTYKNIANEILNTPIPDGLDEQTLATVTGQISTMADPFDRANEDYDRLLNEQLSAIADENLRVEVTKNITGVIKSYADFIKLNDNSSVAKSSGTSEINVENTKIFKQKLLIDPEDKVALLGLKDLYAQNKNFRLAAYFSERIDNLKQVE